MLGYLLPTWGDRITALLDLATWFALTVIICRWLDNRRRP